MTAVFLFLVISQADSVKTLLISGGSIALLIAFMPLVFLALGRYVVPYAPGSEFSLLLMVGLICAVITESLGVYYLVGAFVAGLVARSLSKRMTTLASEQNLEAISLFASFFVPFYFFHNGLGVPERGAGRQLSVVRIYACGVHHTRAHRSGLVAIALHEASGSSRQLRVSIALTPTLIFTLVIAEILRENFAVSPPLYGGLLVYASITSILPSFVLPALSANPVNPIAVEA